MQAPMLCRTAQNSFTVARLRRRACAVKVITMRWHLNLLGIVLQLIAHANINSSTNCCALDSAVRHITRTHK